jgi:hypothetical protein
VSLGDAIVAQRFLLRFARRHARPTLDAGLPGKPCDLALAGLDGEAEQVSTVDKGLKLLERNWLVAAWLDRVASYRLKPNLGRHLTWLDRVCAGKKSFRRRPRAGLSIRCFLLMLRQAPD